MRVVTDAMVDAALREQEGAAYIEFLESRDPIELAELRHHMRYVLTKAEEAREAEQA